MATKMGQWIDDLIGSVGQYVHLETQDGIQREGRLSGFEMRQLNVNGVDVEIPTELEMNGDPNDRVPIDRLKSIRIG